MQTFLEKMDVNTRDQGTYDKRTQYIDKRRISCMSEQNPLPKETSVESQSRVSVLEMDVGETKVVS